MMCYLTIFSKKPLAVLKAFRVIFPVVLRTVALESDKVFALSTHHPVRKDLLDFVFGLAIDDVGWWWLHNPFVRVLPWCSRRHQVRLGNNIVDL